MRQGENTCVGVLVAGLLLLLAACGGAQSAGDGPPGWYPNGDRSQFPSGQWIQGVGVCGPETPEAQRASCAVQRARREVAFNVRTELEASVAMESYSALEHTRGGGRSQQQAFERERIQDAGAAATALDLHNAEPAEVACTSSAHCYALVAVNKAEIVSRLRRENAGDELTLQGWLRDARQADTLAAIQILRRASVLGREIDGRNAMIAGLSGVVPPQEPASQRVTTLSRSVLGSAEVCFASAEASAPASLIFDQSVESMRAMGFASVRVAEARAACGGALLTYVFEGRGESRPSRTTVTDAALMTVEYTGRVHFSVPGAGEQVSRQIRARGVAVAVEQAHDNALRELGEQINGFVLESLER